MTGDNAQPTPPSDTERHDGITRRRLIAVGAGVVVAAVGAQFGRFGVGDRFEEHVGRVLGISPHDADWLLEGARQRLGGGYEVRAAAFLVATTAPGRLAPSDVRRRAIRPLLDALLVEHAESAVLLGLRPRGSRVCAGLVQS